MGGIYGFIDEINDFDKLNKIIESCKCKQKNILNKKWELLYQDRCPKHYVDLEELVKGLDEYNHSYGITHKNDYTHPVL